MPAGLAYSRDEEPSRTGIGHPLEPVMISLTLRVSPTQPKMTEIGSAP